MSYTALHLTALSLLITQALLLCQGAYLPDGIELCGIVGGTCRATNCRHQLVHTWGFALCRDSLNCCVEINTGDSQGEAEDDGGDQAPDATPQTECASHQGTCQLYYHTCSGGTIDPDLDCGMSLHACCVPSSGSSVDYSANSQQLNNRTSEQTVAEHLEEELVSTPNTTTQTPRGRSISHPPGTCGVPNRYPRQKRIVGGEISSAGMWPWHVGIKSAFGHTECAAIVINKDWVITAAHCLKRVQDLSLYRIVPGGIDGRVDESYAIKRVIKHRLYEEHTHPRDQVAHAHKYDIALLELSDSIEFSEKIQPVCLPDSEDNFESQTCWLTGWGSTSTGTSGQANDRRTLRHVRGRVLSKAQCESLWGSLIDGRMKCFGNEDIGACRGDSGGGMFCETSDGRFSLAGIISWGSAQCNRKATVLTDITQYVDWINSQISSN